MVGIELVMNLFRQMNTKFNMTFQEAIRTSINSVLRGIKAIKRSKKNKQ